MGVIKFAKYGGVTLLLMCKVVLSCAEPYFNNLEI